VSDTQPQRKNGVRAARDSDVARRILDASRRLLAEKGWSGITVSDICREAGVYRAAINYYFGSKENLVGVMLEELIRESAYQVLAKVGSIPFTDQRVLETIRAFFMLGGTDLQVAFLESFTHLMRDDDLRAHAERMYRDTGFIAASTLGGGRPEIIPRLYPIGRMIVAFVDGLQIQQLTSPEADFEPAITAFAALLTPAVTQIVDSVPPDASFAEVPAGKAGSG
jgi:TetR/AcrR family transcriptional regulator, repressor for uid operon